MEKVEAIDKKILSERRMFARLRIKLPLKFSEEGKEEKEEAQTVDISANGIGFISKKRLLPETNLEIQLRWEESEPLHLKGRVIWSKELENNQGYRTGVNLEEVNLIKLGKACALNRLKDGD